MHTNSALPLSRRTLLGLAAACVPLASSRAVFAQAVDAGLLTLVFEHLSSQRAYDFVSAFLERGLPVAAALDTDADTGGPVPPEFAQYDGLFEILALTPDVAHLPRFAQSRGAADLRSKLAARVPDGLASIGMLNRRGLEGLDFVAFRSAGFRVFVNMDGTEGVKATPIGRGQIDIRAGYEMDSARTALPLADQCNRLLASGGAHVAVVSLARLADPDDADFAAQLLQLIDLLETKTREGLLVMIRPMDHLLLTGAQLARPTAVLIEVTPQSQAAATALMTRMEASDIPVTVAGSAPILNSLGRADDCLVLASADVSMGITQNSPILARCVITDHSDATPSFGASEIVLQRGGSTILHSRIAADGRLHARLAPWTALLPDAPVLADPVVLIAPADYATAQQRETIAHALETRAQGGKTLFLSATDWASHLIAPDRIYERFQSARRRNVSDPKPLDQQPLTQEARTAFMDDAQAAWAFIADHTIAETGLALSTVQADAGRAVRDRFVNTETTLWDLGSQIQGILAASDIGLIPLNERNARIATLVAHIPVITVDGARLPPAVFSVTTLQAMRREFDVCDLGRFLLALDDAVAKGALAQRDATALTGGWDIDAAVRNGRLHSFRAGRWDDITVSHCTDYILPAFLRLGIKAANLYPPSSLPLAADDAMTVLALAANAGAIGTEPALLEIVEGQAGQIASLLADVLFDAQLGWYEEHGTFRSVSETPINRAPWFVYQGLFLDRTGPDAWAVNSIDPALDHTTAAFRKDTEVIVSKSAYLWYAARPHAFTRATVDLIRDRCRIQGAGFGAGVFAASGEPMDRYMDINTNGIILGALRRILG